MASLVQPARVHSSVDVGVVGAGTAGTAASLLLARAGHRVTLYERVQDPQPVGAGIVLQPTGQAVLERLGLWEPVRERGARIDRLRCVTGAGREVFALDYRVLGQVGGREPFGLGLHRGVLHQTLLAAVREQPGVELRCGVDVARPVAGRGCVELHGADADERLGSHELLVVADGARSQLREHSGLTVRERPYAWGALWHIAADPERIYARVLSQVVRGTGSMLGLLPTGRGPEPDSPPQVSLFWSIRADRLAAFERGDFEAWKGTVLRDDPRAAFVLDSLLTPFFQGDHRWLGWMRDQLMPLATRIPWIRHKMCSSMAGHMRGVFRKALPLRQLAGCRGLMGEGP